jgi:hypothetical protein
VVRAKSFPKWADRASFHCSLSPLYLLDWISRVISLCRYNQHDLSVSGFAADLVTLDGCHLSDLVVVVWRGCVVVFCTVTGLVIAIVAIYGAIFVGCGCWVGAAMVACLVVAGVGLATCLANISSSCSISSSSKSDYSKGSSTGYVEAAGIPYCVFSFISSLAHGVVPSMSSMCFKRLLVLVI